MKIQTLAWLCGLHLLLATAGCTVDFDDLYDRSCEDNSDCDSNVCEDNFCVLDPGANNGSNNGANNGGAQTAMVQGRLEVDSQKQASVEGYTLIAYQAQGGGDLEVVSTQEATAQSDGTYTLMVDTSLVAQGELLVEATGDGEVVGSVLVFGDWEAGQTYSAAEIDSETSVEARVYVEARASGDWNQDCHAVTLRELITAELAATWEQSEQKPQDIDLLVRASLAYMISFGGAMRDEGTEAGQVELEQFIELRTELMAQADARDFQQEQDQALELEARQQSWASAGISPRDAWISVAAATEVMTSYMEDAQPEQADSVHEARAQAQVQLSWRVQSYIEAQMQQGDAFTQEDQQALVEAGAALRARLEASAQLQQGAQQEIEDAWAEFNASVRARLEARLDVASQLAFGQLVEAVAGARTTLEASLEVLASTRDYQQEAEVAVTAYVLFHSSVEEMSGLLTATGTSQVQADATVEILAALR